MTGGVTGGAEVTDGEPMSGYVGSADAELAGADGALLSCVLAGAVDNPDGTAPALLRWLEQPTAVAANATISAVIAVCDVVRFTFNPHYAFKTCPHALPCRHHTRPS